MQANANQQSIPPALVTQPLYLINASQTTSELVVGYVGQSSSTSMVPDTTPIPVSTNITITTTTHATNTEQCGHTFHVPNPPVSISTTLPVLEQGSSTIIMQVLDNPESNLDLGITQNLSILSAPPFIEPSQIIQTMNDTDFLMATYLLSAPPANNISSSIQLGNPPSSTNIINNEPSNNIVAVELTSTEHVAPPNANHNSQAVYLPSLPTLTVIIPQENTLIPVEATVNEQHEAQPISSDVPSTFGPSTSSSAAWTFAITHVPQPFETPPVGGQLTLYELTTTAGWNVLLHCFEFLSLNTEDQEFYLSSYLQLCETPDLLKTFLRSGAPMLATFLKQSTHKNLQIMKRIYRKLDWFFPTEKDIEVIMQSWK